jgi:hypothetical protein
VDDASDGWRKQCSMLSYYMGIPFPETLPDHVFDEKWEQLVWIRKEEAKEQRKRRPPDGQRSSSSRRRHR